MGGEKIESGGPLLYVLDVVQVLTDDHVHPRQQQGGVGRGPDREPVIGLGSHARESGVDNDHTGPPPPRIGEVLHDGVPGVLTDVAADQGETLQAAPIDRLVSADSEPGRQLGSLLPRAQAERRRRFGGIGCAPCLSEVLGEPRIACGVSEDGQRLWSVLVPDLEQAGGRVVEGLLPRHFAELAFASLSGPDHRRLEPVRILGKRHPTLAPGAQHAATLGVVGVPVDLLDYTIDAPHHDPAPPRAHVAHAEGRGDLATPIPGRLDPEPPQTARRGGSGPTEQGRHSAECDTGLQEGAARDFEINTAHRDPPSSACLAPTLVKVFTRVGFHLYPTHARGQMSHEWRRPAPLSRNDFLFR